MCLIDYSRMSFDRHAKYSPMNSSLEKVGKFN